ncbi:hypothetical protein PSA7680_02444 [Pseudoruegeria aquimaris]|uniref:Uncharacterized protein n=1 Tax=Pseudoruegeria aquimaris TaxID=393663 RepID=A0A1Y5SSL6_9RHOB|nr:hypothetical protein PSA7680_02444 [Pseudoruegeria aquimaris]
MSVGSFLAPFFFFFGIGALIGIALTLLLALRLALKGSVWFAPRIVEALASGWREGVARHEAAKAARLRERP